MSDTPRTDYMLEYYKVFGIVSDKHVAASYAAELERELNWAHKRISELEDDLQDAINKPAAM